MSRSFRTTRWSIVARSRDTDRTTASRALGAGIPNWLVVPLAFVISILSTMRNAGVKTPAGMPLLLTMAGTLFCGYELMVVAIDGEATARVGLILTLLVFLVWNAHELRRHGEATLRARRARSADGAAPRKRLRRRRSQR